jgi:predicted amidohydrolase
MKRRVCKLLVVVLILALFLGGGIQTVNLQEPNAYAFGPVKVIDSTTGGNLMPPVNSTSWYTWVPSNEYLSPKFKTGLIGGTPTLKILSKGEYENYGKWLCDLKGIQTGAAYKLSVDYLPVKVTSETTSISALITWNDANGNMLARDYVDTVSTLKDGWKTLSRTLEAPQQASMITVELSLRWTKGDVYFRNPLLLKTAPIVHRKVKVATTLDRPNNSTLAENLNEMLGVIDRAAVSKPDIICLSEAPYDSSVALPAEDKAEAIPGTLTNAISQKARQYSSYIVFGMLEKDNNVVYRTGVLIGRKGEIVGKYRKTHLPLSEAEAGYTPGNSYPVFKTDFGKIAIMICWDQWFSEPARLFRLGGAEMILMPTLGDTSIQAPARAADNGVYLVTSGVSGPQSSKIYNPEGKEIARVNDTSAGYITTEIDLDQKFTQNWLSVGPGAGEPRSLYLKERRPETYGPLTK